MRYMASIDVPSLDDGTQFYSQALGFAEVARPVESYAVLACGDAKIGLLEKAVGTRPAEGSDDVRRYERHWTPVHLDFHVEDFDATLDKVIAAGAKCEQKFTGGDHPPAAFLSDPFGNGFCLIGQRSTDQA